MKVNRNGEIQRKISLKSSNKCFFLPNYRAWDFSAAPHSSGMLFSSGSSPERVTENKNSAQPVPEKYRQRCFEYHWKAVISLSSFREHFSQCRLAAVGQQAQRATTGRQHSSAKFYATDAEGFYQKILLVCSLSKNHFFWKDSEKIQKNNTFGWCAARPDDV